MRPLMALGLPLPSTTVVSSLVATTLPARPRSLRVVDSSFLPNSSVMTVPPVRVATSCSMALRRSPKPGALTANTLSMPRSLFSTRVASGRDLLVVDQDVGVVDDGFHRVGRSHEVG